MLRLFRKIRHQLLSEDKYSTYILYASGEVLLVVAGILLAAEAVLTHTGPKHNLLTEEEASTHLANSMMNANKYVPSPGVLQDLLSSGNLTQITLPVLREMLSEWFIILDNTARTEDEAFQHRSGLLDLLVIHTPFVNIGRDIGFHKIVKAYPDSSNFDGNIKDILIVREFEGRMALYTATLWELSSGSYMNIRQHAEKILAVIESELL